MDSKLREKLLAAQRNEITECLIYERLAVRTKDEHNRKVIEQIARDERRHYERLAKRTGVEVKPSRVQAALYVAIARLFGLSFGLRLMEKGEDLAVGVYGALETAVPEMGELMADEQRHEEEILGMIEEERITYASSMVLGLNDALVELTGALAGLTLALRDPRLIAITGLITGVAASMSMAASEYLASREDDAGDSGKDPLKSAAYTGTAYIITVAILITPYLLLGNVFVSMAVMLTASILIIASYNFYITTAKNQNFWHRFGEMAVISLGVAAVSFGVGFVVNHVFGADA